MQFTIPLQIRFLLIALFLGGGVVASFYISFWWALPLILIGLFLLAGYFLFGTIMGAGHLLQTQQFDAALAHLDKTKFPQYMFKMNRAYYHMIRGTINLYKKNNEIAEKELKISLEIGFQSDNEKGMVMMQLLQLEGQKGNIQSIKNMFREIKELKITEPNLRSQIADLDKQLSNAPSSGRAGMQQMGSFGGGKRPRPKMR
jgi:hypothetical protein